MNKKFVKYTGFFLLIIIIGIFLHSELIGHSSDEQIPKHHDYCNLVSVINQPQQNVSNQINFTILGALFLFINFIAFKTRIDYKKYFLYLPAPSGVQLTILHQSFLI